MKSFPWTKFLIPVLFLILCLNYFSGIPGVPIHPDESTQIYMSADVPKFLQDPSSLAFPGVKLQDDQLRYRLIDSPLTRTFIGTGLLLRGQAPTSIDWDWSKNWQENDQAGALPSADVLTMARYSVAWMFPLSCLFLFMTVKKLGGWLAALISVVLFATNALILLHTRRAMAESALICLLCASVWCLLCVDKRVWLAAIPVGLAINAKQTLFPLAGFGLLNMVFKPIVGISKINRFFQTVIFSAIVLLITWGLNPVYWKSPIPALQTGLDLRSELTVQMSRQHQNIFTALERSAILIGQVFIQPLAIGDVSNYLADTQKQTDLYYQNPVNNLFRGFIAGAIFLGLSIIGWGLLIRDLFSSRAKNKYPAGAFLTMTIGMILTVMFFTPVNFQRYYLVVVPFIIIAQAFALSSISTIIFRGIKKGLPLSNGSPR